MSCDNHPPIRPQSGAYGLHNKVAQAIYAAGYDRGQFLLPWDDEEAEADRQCCLRTADIVAIVISQNTPKNWLAEQWRMHREQIRKLTAERDAAVSRLKEMTAEVYAVLLKPCRN